MPGSTEGIGAHKIHPVDMTLSFVCSSTSDLEIKKKLEDEEHYQENIQLLRFWQKIKEHTNAPSFVPRTRIGDEGNGDDCDGPLNLKCYKNSLILLVWFAKYLIKEPAAQRCTTATVKKAMGLQMCIWAPPKVYSSLASYTYQWYIYRGKVIQLLLLQQQLSPLIDFNTAYSQKIWESKQHHIE